MKRSLPRAEPTVAEVMRTHFVTSSPGDSLPDARQTMRLARLRHLLVTADDELVGLLSYRTLLETLLEGRSDARVIADLMAPRPGSVTPDTPLPTAADRLCRYGFGCLPVVEAEGNRLVGLVTEVDLLHFAFRRRRRRPGNGRSNGEPA